MSVDSASRVLALFEPVITLLSALLFIVVPLPPVEVEPSAIKYCDDVPPLLTNDVAVAVPSTFNPSSSVVPSTSRVPPTVALLLIATLTAFRFRSLQDRLLDINRRRGGGGGAVGGSGSKVPKGPKGPFGTTGAVARVFQGLGLQTIHFP